MAKLVPTVALISFLLVVLAASSSAYRTIVTTVEIDNPTGSQSCRQEAQRRDLSACENFIRRSRSSSDDDFLALQNPQEEQMRRCCNQLQQVRDDCQCEAFKYVVEQQLQRGGREETQSMKQRARQIPSQCGIQQCEMRFGFF
ncbi:2S seed storage albumin protein [Euphorbia peplus]|nr:2S seed storage albumin protein [Euphorbia peplus]